MKQRPPRRSRGRARPSAEPKGEQLWLFPSDPRLRSALSGRSEETRQLCCKRGRLAVVERGGVGVQVHQLRVGSHGASKTKCIKLREKMKIHSVDQGAEHMLILSSDGKPFEYNYNPKLERLPCILQEQNIIQITCGDYHSLALSKGGELFAWGQNVHGQLGLGKELDSMPKPQIVERLSGVPLAQISAGKAHSMALSMSGNIYSWGRNNFGQLGLGHTDNEDFPSLIEALDNRKVKFLACGGSHTAALTQDGLLFTFGAGKYGQLGHNSTQNELKPCLVTELVGNRVTQIACGRKHTLAYVSALGKVFSFGSGKEGQLGNGGTHNQLVPLPMKSPSKEELRFGKFHGSTGFESHTSGMELILIAGGNQSILLWIKKENSYVNLRRTIPTLNDGTVRRWIVDAGTKQWQNTKREIREIFSSPACLTGSFMRERESGVTNSIDVDLQMASDTFEKLTKQKWISLTVTTCLKDNLLRALPCHPLHQEALLIFLLLPQCPVMHEVRNSESLVVPFAKVVCNMCDKSLDILRQCWASLQDSSLNTLVQMLKSAIITQLYHFNKTDHSNCNVKPLLRMMKEVYTVNKANCQLPENTFNIEKLSDWLNIYREIKLKSFFLNATPAGKNPHFFLSEFPFIFNLLSKMKLWEIHSQIKKMMLVQIGQLIPSGMNEFHPSRTLFLQVRRSHLTEDALRQLSQAKNTDLQKGLMVEFINEICSVGKGVKSEFFHCIFEEMTRKEYGLFIYPEEGSYMWFPVKTKFEKKRYFLFGVLCGLSLYDLNIADIPFPLALFKKLQHQEPSLEDLKELSPVFAKNLQELLNYEDDDIGEAVSMYFSIHWDQKDVDLIPNGISVLVDQTNKKDYVSKCVDYIFNTSVKAVYEEFQRGFYTVCDAKILRLFHPEELMTAIVGNTDYDWIQFEMNSTYMEGYHASHPTILMFWKAFHRLTLDEKKKFLFFLTGNDRLTVRGLQKLGIRFSCPETFSEADFPRSYVCHNILDFPKYSTAERVEEALQEAINNNRGFVKQK